MKKILLTALLALSFLPSCRAQTVFTFECFCGYLTVADGNCDVCGPTLQSRMFTGIIIRRNGVPHKWIETPYTVRFNGQVARFQELVYPNPETINIDRSQTPYGTLDSFKMAIQCPCVGGGGRDTIVIDSSGAVCAALYFFANDTAAIASPTTDQYDYYLTAPENYYGLPAGLVKLAWETTLPDSANAPGCGSGGSGTGTVTSFSFTDGGGFTGTVLNSTTTPTLSLVLQDAAADGATKGKATFTAADFNSAAGVISLDYVNGQKANGSQPGFLSSTDWTTFNGKLTANAPITGATKTKITYDANGLVTAGADATTSDIAEGSNLYYTDERNDDRTAALIQNNTGISWSYNDGAGTLTPTLSDPSATNEGALSVGAGLSTTSEIQSNTSGDLPIVLRAGSNVTLSESGDTITIATSGGGDNLGNHTATQDLNMAGYNEKNVDTLYMEAGGAHTSFLTTSNSGLYLWDRITASPLNRTSLQMGSGFYIVSDDGSGNYASYAASPSGITGGITRADFSNAILSLSTSNAVQGFSNYGWGGVVQAGEDGVTVNRRSVDGFTVDEMTTINDEPGGVYVHAIRNFGGNLTDSRLYLLSDAATLMFTPGAEAYSPRVKVYGDSVLIGIYDFGSDPDNPFNQVVWRSADSSQYLHYTRDRRSNIIQDPNAIPDVKSIWQISGKAFSTTVTTDGYGAATISHPFGYTPQAIVVTYEGNNAYFVTVTAKTTSDFSIKAWDASGSAVASTSINISYWIR